jgi:hypothetical protein
MYIVLFYPLHIQYLFQLYSFYTYGVSPKSLQNMAMIALMVNLKSLSGEDKADYEDAVCDNPEDAAKYRKICG